MKVFWNSEAQLVLKLFLISAKFEPRCSYRVVLKKKRVNIVSVNISVRLSFILSVCISYFLSVHLSVCLSVCPSIRPSTLSVCLVCPFVCLSSVSLWFYPPVIPGSCDDYAYRSPQPARVPPMLSSTPCHWPELRTWAHPAHASYYRPWLCGSASHACVAMESTKRVKFIFHLIILKYQKLKWFLSKIF